MKQANVEIESFRIESFVDDHSVRNTVHLVASRVELTVLVGDCFKNLSPVVAVFYRLATMRGSHYPVVIYDCASASDCRQPDNPLPFSFFSDCSADNSAAKVVNLALFRLFVNFVSFLFRFFLVRRSFSIQHSCCALQIRRQERRIRFFCLDVSRCLLQNPSRHFRNVCINSREASSAAAEAPADHSAQNRRVVLDANERRSGIAEASVDSAIKRAGAEH